MDNSILISIVVGVAIILAIVFVGNKLYEKIDTQAPIICDLDKIIEQGKYNRKLIEKYIEEDPKKDILSIVLKDLPSRVEIIASSSLILLDGKDFYENICGRYFKVPEC